MKRTYKMMIATGLVVLSSTSAFAVITNSKHDLSSGSSASVKDAGQNQICIFCHTPHNASQTNLLWNRGTTNISATYTMYSSTTASTTVNNAPAVDASTTSYLCLSCHDGSINDMNTNTKNYGGLAKNLVDANDGLPNGWDALYKIGAGPNLAGNPTQGSLQDDHPINFVYTVKSGIKALGTAKPLLMADNNKEPFDANGRMQCGSCHLVHNESTAAPAPNYLLRVTEESSNLCKACHDK